MNYNPETYDSNYQCPQSQSENLELKRYLANLKGETLDLGCGTGLGYELLEDKSAYLGIDNNPEMIKQAKKKHPEAHFQIGNAFQFLRYNQPKENIISLFSINYMHPETLDLIVKKTLNTAIIISYNKPWIKGSQSAYSGQKDLFEANHPSHTQLTAKLKEWPTLKLLHQPYYFITIIRKRHTHK